MPVIIYSSGSGSGAAEYVTEDISAQILLNVLTGTYFTSAAFKAGSLSVFFNGSLMTVNKDYIELDDISFQFTGLLQADLIRIFTSESILVVKYLPV